MASETVSVARAVSSDNNDYEALALKGESFTELYGEAAYAGDAKACREFLRHVDVPNYPLLLAVRGLPEWALDAYMPDPLASVREGMISLDNLITGAYNANLDTWLLKWITSSKLMLAEEEKRTIVNTALALNAIDLLREVIPVLSTPQLLALRDRAYNPVLAAIASPSYALVLQELDARS